MFKMFAFTIFLNFDLNNCKVRLHRKMNNGKGNIECCCWQRAESFPDNEADCYHHLTVYSTMFNLPPWEPVIELVLSIFIIVWVSFLLFIITTSQLHCVNRYVSS